MTYYICHECGTERGTRMPAGAATMFMGDCDFCGQHRTLCNSMKYGYPKKPDHFRGANKMVMHDAHVTARNKAGFDAWCKGLFDDAQLAADEMTQMAQDVGEYE